MTDADLADRVRTLAGIWCDDPEAGPAELADDLVALVNDWADKIGADAARLEAQWDTMSTELLTEQRRYLDARDMISRQTDEIAQLKLNLDRARTGQMR